MSNSLIFSLCLLEEGLISSQYTLPLASLSSPLPSPKKTGTIHFSVLSGYLAVWLSNYYSPLQHECSQTGSVVPLSHFFFFTGCCRLFEEGREHPGVAKVRKVGIWAFCLHPQYSQQTLSLVPHCSRPAVAIPNNFLGVRGLPPVCWPPMQ